MTALDHGIQLGTKHVFVAGRRTGKTIMTGKYVEDHLQGKTDGEALWRHWRAWELSFELQVWLWTLTIDFAPTIWRRWMFTRGFAGHHAVVGPVHAYVANHGLPRIVMVSVTTRRNAFWWDKLQKLKEKKT